MENNKDLEDFSNNQILFEIKKLEAEHEAIKIKMYNDYEKMEALEIRFARASDILTKRLKGE